MPRLVGTLLMTPTVTYAYNYWSNLNSRTPSFRFGTGHIYNNGSYLR
jgi:pectate lyase